MLPAICYLPPATCHLTSLCANAPATSTHSLLCTVNTTVNSFKGWQVLPSSCKTHPGGTTRTHVLPSGPSLRGDVDAPPPPRAMRPHPIARRGVHRTTLAPPDVIDLRFFSPAQAQWGVCTVCLSRHELSFVKCKSTKLWDGSACAARKNEQG